MKIEKIMDKIENAELCPKCKAMLMQLAVELKKTIMEQMKDKQFEKQGLMTDLIFIELENIAIKTILDIAVDLEHRG